MVSKHLRNLAQPEGKRTTSRAQTYAVNRLMKSLFFMFSYYEKSQVYIHIYLIKI